MKHVLIGLLKAYRTLISPLYGHRSSRIRTVDL